MSPIDDAGLLSLLCLLTIRRVAIGPDFTNLGGGGGGGGGGGTDPKNAGARTVGLLLEIASRTGLKRSTSWGLAPDTGRLCFFSSHFRSFTENILY